MSEFGPATPILRSFDEAKAREFYVDFLGFAVDFEHRFEPDAPLYLGLRRGDCVLHVSEHYGDSTPGLRIRIPVTGLAHYATSLAAQEYSNARPGAPSRQPWGDLELTLTDPFGNRLTLYEKIE